MTIEEYLNSHGVNQETLDKFNITYDKKKDRIIIPVTDIDGTFLYNKYRNLNDPDKKYEFDPGSKAQIFNPQALKSKFVVVTEGEMDTVRLVQEGIPAVSGTAGAKTFPEEWKSLFDNKTLFFCYDNDTAGKEAITKLAKFFPKALVAQIPEGFKDVCEFFAAGKTKTDFYDLLAHAKNNHITTFSYTSPHKTLRAKALLEHQFPPVVWLVEDLIPAEGFTAITGAPFSFKSFITEYMAVCVSEGRSMFDKFKTEKGAVLMIDKENSKALIKDRLVKLGCPVDPDIYFLDDPDHFDLHDDDTLAWTVQFVIENNIKCVVVDSFVHIHKGDENDSGAIAKTFERLKRIPAAIVFIHHHRKAVKFFTGTILESIRGSSDIGAELEAHIALDPDNRGNIKVTQGKNRWGVLTKPFNIQPLITDQAAVFEYIGEITDGASKVEEARASILATLENQQEISRQIFIEMLAGKVSERIIVDQLKSLEKDQIITSEIRNRQKYYSFTAKGTMQRTMQIAEDEVSPSEQSYLDFEDD